MKSKIKRTKELQRKFHEMREKMSEKTVPNKKKKYDRRKEKTIERGWDRNHRYLKHL